MKTNKKQAFTIVEVSILFVIFLIVAFLVVPLSLDDTIDVNNRQTWKNVQPDFENIFYSINTQKGKKDFDLRTAFDDVMNVELKGDIEPYRITFMDGTYPGNKYRFSNYKKTVGNRVVAYKFLDSPEGDLYGYLMYDVNGMQGPNLWGKDVFGLNIYSDRFEPFCKNDSVQTQKQDCTKNGSGLCCSNLVLTGGNFDK